MYKNILGLNKRNLFYLLELNQKKKYALVDNKLLTKNILISNNISVPYLYATFKSYFELKFLKERIFSFSSFVIKPAQGFGANGIIILEKKQENLWEDSSGKIWKLEDIKLHISFIISGMFSLSNQKDIALVEEKINSPSIFKNIISTGLPDIRIIVYKKTSVMAMIRFPSFISNGCANLHKGGIGVGININTGCTKFGFYKNKKITVHPDTNKILTNLQIPNWQEIINLAIKSCEIVDINYLGVDMVLNEDEKPIVMELNARPGLSIQMANFTGLIPLLKNIK